MFGINKPKEGSKGMEKLAMILKPFLPMVKPHLPSLMNMISEFLPDYMGDVAKKHNVEKVVFLIDVIEENGKKVSIIKFMSVKDGRMDILKKEDGSPYVERASDLMSQMLEIGLSAMNKKADSDED